MNLQKLKQAKVRLTLSLNQLFALKKALRRWSVEGGQQVDDDFKYYGDYLYFREYPDAPDAYELEGMQLAMGSAGPSSEQIKKFESQSAMENVTEAGKGMLSVGKGMADIGAASAKGVAQGFGGIFGDFEMLGRGIKEIYNRGGDETKLDAFLRGIQEETILPTTEDIKKWLDTNVGKVGAGDNPYETVGEMLAPGGYVKGGKKIVQGVKKAKKAVAGTAAAAPTVVDGKGQK
jgi:hypothetical protein